MIIFFVNCVSFFQIVPAHFWPNSEILPFPDIPKYQPIGPNSDNISLNHLICAQMVLSSDADYCQSIVWHLRSFFVVFVLVPGQNFVTVDRFQPLKPEKWVCGQFFTYNCSPVAHHMKKYQIFNSVDCAKFCAGHDFSETFPIFQLLWDIMRYETDKECRCLVFWKY